MRCMATDSEIKSAAGISNVEHSHYSKKEFQKLKDKEHVSIESIVDTTQMDIEKIAADDLIGREVLKEKNSFLDKEGGGYAQKGSKESALGNDGFVGS